MVVSTLWADGGTVLLVLGGEPTAPGRHRFRGGGANITAAYKRARPGNSTGFGIVACWPRNATVTRVCARTHARTLIPR